MVVVIARPEISSACRNDIGVCEWSGGACVVSGGARERGAIDVRGRERSRVCALPCLWLVLCA